MKYIDLINIGFRRHNSNDNVHFEETGNSYFYLSKKLVNGVEACWYPEKQGAPVGISFPEDTSNEFFIYDLDTLKKLLVTFTKRECPSLNW